MKYIPLFEEFINESLKAKKPNDIIEIDIDFAGSDSDLRKLSKKHKLEVDEYEPGMVLLKGKKKDILDYLQSDEYDMDPEDIKDLFPEILESDIVTIKMNRLNEAKSLLFSFDYNTDEDDVDYIQRLLKDARVDAIAQPGLDSEEMIVKAANAIELRKAKKAIQANGFEIYEGKIAYDKVAKALYGTTAQSDIPQMDEFLGVKSGDMVTTIAVPLNQGSELFSFVTSLPKGSAWMGEKSIFGSKTMYAAFNNMSQSDFDSLKSSFPKAEVTNLDQFNKMKTRSKASAEGNKLSNVGSVEDSAAKY
jgi:hypothetical protein